MSVFIFTVSLVLSVRADLPVHCLAHHIHGTWLLTLGPPSPERLSCGHAKPDNESAQPAVSLDTVDRQMRVTLSKPNVAVTDLDLGGRWTMIYDEGFEVNVEGFSLFAFSRFESVNGTNVSKCGETQVGWYRSADRSLWGCYFGRKESPSLALQRHHSLISTSPGRLKKSTNYDQPLTYEYHSYFADLINEAQDWWTATVYPWFAGRSVRDMNQKAGIRRVLPSRPNVTNLPSSFLQAKSLRGNPKHSKSWDWRNVSGRNYLDDVIDQGECGSCYTVATIRMLSARHRIKQGDASLEPFSMAFPLHCSEYNQGCMGGYAFLTSKWSQDVGLVPKSCGDLPDVDSCQLSCRLQGTRWRADNHRYVGNYYGGSNEDNIIEELINNGPLVLSFEPQSDLMYYRGGVYRGVPGQREEWEQVDHAILLVGYGEVPRSKYWLLQNSWGHDWGEQGFIRMSRGRDESGIESIAVAADVVEDEMPQVLNHFTRLL